MTEILTESFCERCGTRYTFESARPRVRLKGVKVLSRGLKNFVLSDETTMDEAMASARSETDRELTAHQLDAFHKTFNFCMSCRQYTCPNCWNEVEARCLSCAPHLGHEIMPAPFPDLAATVPFGSDLVGASEVADLVANGSHGANGSNGTVTGDAEIDPGAAEANDDDFDAMARLDALNGSPDEAGTPEPGARPGIAEKSASQTGGLLRRFRPGQSLDEELAAFERQEQDSPAVTDESGEAVAQAQLIAQAEADAKAELARNAELARETELAEEAERAELIRQAELHELAAQAEAARQAELEAQAELAAKAELARQAELRRQAELAAATAEATRQAELAAQAELVAQAEAARQAELAAQAEAARQAELAELVEQAAQAEAARQAEAAAEAELVAQAEAVARAELAAQAEAAAQSESVARAEADRQAELATQAEVEEVVEVEAIAEPEVVGVAAEIVAAADAEPEVAAPPDTDPTAVQDVAPQPTWRMVAPDATSDLPSVPAPADAVPNATPQWPASPAWPTGAPSAGLPFLGRPVAPTGGIEALWAESSREVTNAPVLPGKPVASGVQPCISCGLSLSANARFCRRCGTHQVG